MTKPINYGTARMVLDRGDVDQPCMVGLSSWLVDTKPFSNIENNDEAILLLRKEMEEPNPDLVHEGFDEPPAPGEGEEDDYVIEVIALSVERLTEIMTWVGARLQELVPGEQVVEHVGFKGVVELSVNGVDKFCATTYREPPEPVVEEEAALSEDDVETDPEG